MKLFGNLDAVLSSGRSARARAIPWVAALRGYGATIQAGSSGLTIQYHLDTTGRTLTPAQLPFAAGSAIPSLASGAPISTGIHDPAQIFQFVEAAEQASSAASYGRFLRRQAALRAKTGIDINSLVKLLSGELIVGSNSRTTIARVGVIDPSAAARTLSKLASSPSGLFSRAERSTKLAGGIYSIKEPRRSIDIGVVGNQLVAGNVNPARLHAFAAAPATPATGAKGTVAFRVSLPQLLRMRLRRPPSQAVASILSQLGDITGWNSAGPSGVNGDASVAIK